MRHILILCSLLFPMVLFAQPKEKELLSKINLNYKGLRKVKKAAQNKDYDKALVLLTQYYKNRSSVKHIDFVDGSKPYAFSSSDSMKAHNGMKHLFFVHYGYGCLDYGDTINWNYWPIKDNEIRWQVNRMYWWIPMAKLYHQNKDEKVVKEWIFQFRDWIKDNPKGVDHDIDRYAWRPLETARRVQDGTNLFEYFKGSPNFDASFLLDFLSLYHKQVQHVRDNYSAQGNHLLFEAQRMIYAGCYFPEFKDAAQWRKEGIEILEKELPKQIFNDGFQYELSPNYHVATIEIFSKALRMAELSGQASEFPKDYKATIERMIMATVKMGMSDMTYPMFGDAKRPSASSMRKNYKKWTHMFPNNNVIRYFATNCKKGSKPTFTSTLMEDCGFFSMRSGWDKKDLSLIMKAGPSGHFHCQPDNGTFSLMYKGTLLMPDAGCYVYSGGPKVKALREAYRKSAVHQTLTVDNKDITLGSYNKKLEMMGNVEVASYDNDSYTNSTHHREIYFVDHRFFLIYDRLDGEVQGDARVRFQVKEGKAKVDKTKKQLCSFYKKKANILVQNVNSKASVDVEEENLTVSYSYRKEKKRKGVAFKLPKTKGQTTEFYTIVYPYDGMVAPKVKVKVSKKSFKIEVRSKKNSKENYSVKRL